MNYTHNSTTSFTPSCCKGSEPRKKQTTKAKSFFFP